MLLLLLLLLLMVMLPSCEKHASKQWAHDDDRTPAHNDEST